MELNSRQEQVLEILLHQDEVRVTELKEKFQVTEMTVRRDLEKLEQLGLARRTFGGAIAVMKETTLNQRNTLMLEEKMQIGRAAAALLRPGDSVFIDGGSTNLQLAKAIPGGSAVTVVTNALNVALELLGKQVPTILIGGRLVETTGSAVGPVALDNLRKMAFTRVFLGASGMSSRHGFSNSNMDETEIKKQAIRCGSEVNVLLDHSKFGQPALFSFAILSDVHRIVVDKEPDEEAAASCRAARVDILVARSASAHSGDVNGGSN